MIVLRVIRDRREASQRLRPGHPMFAFGYFAISPTTTRFGGLTITILSLSLTNL